MNANIDSAIQHMCQGLAHWMAFRGAMSSIQLIEADLAFVAVDILRASLSNDYKIIREVTKKELSIIPNKERIDVGIFSKKDNKFVSLIEFKLADATNGGYVNDIVKLEKVKNRQQDIDCLVVILYRKSCLCTAPKLFLDPNGHATKKQKSLPGCSHKVAVRHVCNSFSSTTNKNSKKTICLEVL